MTKQLESQWLFTICNCFHLVVSFQSWAFKFVAQNSNNNKKDLSKRIQRESSQNPKFLDLYGKLVAAQTTKIKRSSTVLQTLDILRIIELSWFGRIPQSLPDQTPCSTEDHLKSNCVSACNVQMVTDLYHCPGEPVTVPNHSLSKEPFPNT